MPRLAHGLKFEPPPTRVTWGDVRYNLGAPYHLNGEEKIGTSCSDGHLAIQKQSNCEEQMEDLKGSSANAQKESARLGDWSQASLSTFKSPRLNPQGVLNKRFGARSARSILSSIVDGKIYGKLSLPSLKKVPPISYMGSSLVCCLVSPTVNAGGPKSSTASIGEGRELGDGHNITILSFTSATLEKRVPAPPSYLFLLPKKN
ncbi:hypothetical protein EDB83DRAFT_2309342 [Lactarius deliciosus]|nr:hypothetical protein EDB83DRAFT_2309342 [Lactarius deliciosus]